MNWLDKLERKLGRFAIPNLTVYLLVGYVIGFGIMYLMPEMIGYLTLEPALILRGQVWRLISWVLIPPSTNLISLVSLYFYTIPLEQLLRGHGGASGIMSISFPDFYSLYWQCLACMRFIISGTG